MSKKLRVFGCGGAGINLVTHYFGKDAEAGMAEMAPALIDTSRSNLMGRKIDEDSTYLVEGLMAPVRSAPRTTTLSIRPSNRSWFKSPCDMNVVVFSASGGSGSVIGPLIIKHLNEKQIPVIAMVIGSDESTIAAENTLKTIKSLELVAKNSNMPVIMSFHKNDLAGRRSDVDRSVWSVISCLSILSSGQNAEMDYRDLVHWVQYTKINGGRAQLATMHVATSAEHMKRITSPLSVASLYGNPDQEHLATSADYQSVGYTDLSNTDFDQIHFVIGVNDLSRIGRDLKSQVSQLLEERGARLDVDSILDSEDNTDQDVVL